MLNQTRIWVGSITFHRMGSMKGKRMSSLCPNPEICIHFYFQILFWVTQPLFFSADYAYLIGRHADSNRKGGR